MTEAKTHWDGVYARQRPDDASWFQPSLQVSLRLIDALSLGGGGSIIDVGGGASTLVDDLIDRGFGDVTVLDISANALAASRARLGSRGDSVTWLAADITKANLAENKFRLWHDRAVFHFLTDPHDRAAYVKIALRSLEPGGHIIVATFGLEGPKQCSGLDVTRYDAEGIHREFGSDFTKISSVLESHKTPWGKEQEFVYCYCRRQ